jgi:hypothetical protein
VPYRVPAENEAARLEAEEFRRDLGSMRTRTVADWIRIGAVTATVFAVLSVLYGTFRSYVDLARADDGPDLRCRDVIEISRDGTTTVQRVCGDFHDR